MEFRAFFADEFGSSDSVPPRLDGTSLPPPERSDFPGTPDGMNPAGPNGVASIAAEILARSMLTKGGMHQNGNVERIGEGTGAARREGRGTASAPATWQPEEQPDFGRDLRQWTGPESGRPVRLRLSDEAAWHRQVVWRMSAASLATSTDLSTPGTRGRGSRRRIVVPILLLAIVTTFGYVTASRSVAAFQAAWRRADAIWASESSRETSVYQYDDARIPGPFNPVPSEGLGPMLGFLGASEPAKSLVDPAPTE